MTLRTAVSQESGSPTISLMSVVGNLGEKTEAVVTGLSSYAEPVFDPIDIHADFLDFGFIFEDFACGCCGISGDWIVYSNYFERFSLSSCSTEQSGNHFGSEEGLRFGYHDVVKRFPFPCQRMICQSYSDRHVLGSDFGRGRQLSVLLTMMSAFARAPHRSAKISFQAIRFLSISANSLRNLQHTSIMARNSEKAQVHPP